MLSKAKPGACILDATAGNRTIWIKKNNPHILFIDIEPELPIKPDLLLDCTKTGFPDNSFNIIFFDPPHSYGRTKNTGIHQTPSLELQKKKWNDIGSYYGFDKYPTKRALMSFLHKAQLEFERIIKPGGVLWFKWSEIHSTLNAVLPLFDKWEMVMKFEVAYQGRVGKNPSWWVMMMPVQTSKSKEEVD